MVIFLSYDIWVKVQAKHAPLGEKARFRGGKYELYEGGIHSPCIVKWSGRVRPGAEIQAPSVSLDWFPTLAAAAGVRARPANALDASISLPRCRAILRPNAACSGVSRTLR
jgi:arylsulfatase A-like enzyme